MSTKNILLIFFVLFKITLQYFLVNPVYDLQRDEYLHLDQAKHLAWGYESVPPFTSWVSWIILQLGNGVFWVKFFPALFGALTMVTVWKAIEALKGNLFALILGATAVTLSVIMRLNMLYQPNSFDVLCWTFLYFAFLRYIQTNGNKWLYLAAITFAIGFLNKYNIVFLLLGLSPAILLTEHRKVFQNKHLYFALGIAIILVAPNLIWQFQNNFPVVHHMKTLSATQLVNVNRSGFLKEQLLFFSGSLFVLIAAFISFFKFQPFKKYRVYAWSFILCLAIFVYLKAKGYYAIGLYPILLAFGSVYIENILQNGWRIYLRPVAILVVVVLFIPFVKLAFPVAAPDEVVKNNQLIKKLGLLRWEDGKEHLIPQDYADMLGWRELAAKTDSVFERIADKENALIICDNYGQAGAINYYSKFKNIGAVSTNADYINWFPLDKKQITQVILIDNADNPETEKTEEKKLFKTVTLEGQVENIYAREKGTRIYLLKDAFASVNQLLKQEIIEEKSKQ